MATKPSPLCRRAVRILHQKHYFTAENGWQGPAWFEPERHGVEVADVAGVTVGPRSDRSAFRH
jgi:hypothetical protein